MSDRSAHTHNQLADEFVQKAGRATHNDAELLVVIESTMLATLQLLTRLYGVRETDASIYLERALHRATERFSELNK